MKTNSIIELVGVDNNNNKVDLKCPHGGTGVQIGATSLASINYS